MSKYNKRFFFSSKKLYTWFEMNYLEEKIHHFVQREVHVSLKVQMIAVGVRIQNIAYFFVQFYRFLVIIYMHRQRDHSL